MFFLFIFFFLNLIFLFFFFFFFNDTATTEIYTVPYTLSLHDALPIRSWTSSAPPDRAASPATAAKPRRSAASRSEEHTSELQSHGTISYAVFCLKKKKGSTLSLHGDLVCNCYHA